MRITAFTNGLQGGHYWHLWILRGTKEKVSIENIPILLFAASKTLSTLMRKGLNRDYIPIKTLLALEANKPSHLIM